MKGIHIRYAYDISSDFHIVEVAPESIRRGNKEYKEAETELWESFLEQFPHSDLLISEPCGCNDMTNILFS